MSQSSKEPKPAADEETILRLLGDRSKWNSFQALTDLSRLSQLNISRQGLSHLPCLLRMFNLKLLDASANSISAVSTNALPSKLEVLSLRWNTIGELSKSRPSDSRAISSSLSCKPRLWKLDLGHNRIEAIDPQLFLQTQNLRDVDLSYNQLDTSLACFDSCRHLHAVNLSNNFLARDSHLESFKHSAGLRHLDLRNNPLSSSASPEALKKTIGGTQLTIYLGYIQDSTHGSPSPARENAKPCPDAASPQKPRRRVSILIKTKHASNSRTPFAKRDRSSSFDMEIISHYEKPSSKKTCAPLDPVSHGSKVDLRISAFSRETSKTKSNRRNPNSTNKQSGTAERRVDTNENISSNKVSKFAISSNKQSVNKPLQCSAGRQNCKLNLPTLRVVNFDPSFKVDSQKAKKAVFNVSKLLQSIQPNPPKQQSSQKSEQTKKNFRITTEGSQLTSAFKVSPIHLSHDMKQPKPQVHPTREVSTRLLNLKKSMKNLNLIIEQDSQAICKTNKQKERSQRNSWFAGKSSLNTFLHSHPNS